MHDPIAGIEKIIQEAQQEGKFDDLEGKGKPLALDTSPDAVIKNLLKEANVKPEWIEIEQRIDRLLAEAETLREAFAREAQETRARLIARQGGACIDGAQSLPARRRGGLLAWLFRGDPTWARGGKDRVPPPPQAWQSDALAAYHRRWEVTLRRYATLLHRANREIRRYNLVVPLIWRQRAPVPLGERLAAFAERVPCLAPGPDGSLQPTPGVVPASLLAPPQEDASEARFRRDLRQAAALQQMRRFGRRPPPIG